MIEPSYLRATRAAYDAVAAAYADWVSNDLAASPWTVHCLARSPNSCTPTAQDQSPTLVAVPAT